MLHPEDGVGGHDDLAVRRPADRRAGQGADGDQHVGRAQPPPPFPGLDRDHVRALEGGATVHDLDVVAPQHVLDDADLALDHLSDMADQLLHGGPGARLSVAWRLEPRP